MCTTRAQTASKLGRENALIRPTSLARYRLWPAPDSLSTGKKLGPHSKISRARACGCSLHIGTPEQGTGVITLHLPADKPIVAIVGKQPYLGAVDGIESLSLANGRGQARGGARHGGVPRGSWNATTESLLGARRTREGASITSAHLEQEICAGAERGAKAMAKIARP